VGYHVVNLVLHVVAVLLLFIALRRLVAESAAFWSALLFAVHPLQSEAVAYVFARGTLLSTALCLACLYFWLRQRWIVVVLLFGCALMAKEECVTFPLFLLLLPSVRNVRCIFWMLGLAAAAGLRAVWATALVVGSGAGFTAGISPLRYFGFQGAAIIRYLRLLFVPWGFTIEPDITLPYPALYVIAWLIVLGIAVAAWTLRKRSSWALWVLSGLILLIPSSSVFPAADLAADRRMYLPMIAFGTAFGVLAPWLRKPAPAAIVAVLLSLSIFRMMVWRTEQSLWREAVERSPRHSRPLLQLSRAVGDEEALDLLLRAKQLEPNNGAIFAELGRQWLKVGRYSFALQEFGRALALQPYDANALNNRGAALLAMKQYQAARLDFERALKIDPCVQAARRNLAALGGSVLPPCPATGK